MIRRDELIDIPERRAVPIAEFEVREKNGVAHVEGYASIFDKGYPILGGPDAGGFTEIVNRTAFDTTLKAEPDVVLLENHTGGPLARTKSGTLQLATDSTGLIPSFDLDLRDPQAKSVFVKLDRKDYDEMSFAFRVKAQTWSEDDTIRGLDEVSLHKGDVSIVNYGANPFTSVGLRSAVKTLAREDFSEEELAELRAMSEQVDAAMARLQDARAAEPKPYGDVTYADPKNGKYPIDSAEHTKAAWSYINQAKNADEYSADELSEIKGRIKAAAEKFGIDIAEKNAAIYVDVVPVLPSKSELVEIIKRAVDDDGIQGPDNDEGGGDSIARAVHDLVADAAGCVPPPGPTNVPNDLPYNRNLTVEAAEDMRVPVSKGNLSLADAVRMCRPEDSQDPLTVEQAEQLAS